MEKPGQVIGFNVGGIKYLTSISTLEAEPDNVLLKMTSGSFPTTRYEDAYFIDRNGKLFEHILDYLRNVRTWVPPDNIDLNSLIREADFYLLLKLKEILKKSQEIDPDYKLRQETPIVHVTFELLGDSGIYAIHINNQDPVSHRIRRREFYDGYDKDLNAMKRRLENNLSVLFRMGYRLVRQKGKNPVTYIFQSKD